MNNKDIYYLVIDKQEETLRKFVFSECVTNFLIGKNYKDYIVIKSKYGKVSLYENYNNLDELEQQLHHDTFDKEYSYLPCIVNNNIVDITINPRIPIEHIKIDIKVDKSRINHEQY